MSGWELVAVLLSLAYLLLAMRQNNLCWYAAFVSTAIFTVLFWDASLLMESALQVYYLAMALYGWYQWRNGDTGRNEPLSISRWSLSRHLLAIAGVLLLTLISGGLLAGNTSAALPYLDSFTTWGAVLTTYMVTRKILENWLYWLVIDGLSIYLYLDRGLLLTAGLFCLYELIVVFGFIRWYREYRQAARVGFSRPAAHRATAQA
ncbi:nicotinamide riboside transporter PnuC [Marinobacterium sp. CAU 1594]|nr:nicotinamide riboside transporter PnuC [Marinobacterium arenosum]